MICSEETQNIQDIPRIEEKQKVAQHLQRCLKSTVMGWTSVIGYSTCARRGLLLCGLWRISSFEGDEMSSGLIAVDNDGRCDRTVGVALGPLREKCQFSC